MTLTNLGIIIALGFIYEWRVTAILLLAHVVLVALGSD
jgi:hypothetical protein